MIQFVLLTAMLLLNCEYVATERIDASIKTDSVDYKHEIVYDASTPAKESTKAEDVLTWDEILASAILSGLKEVFFHKSSDASVLVDKVSPVVSVFGKILQFHKVNIYDRFHHYRRVEIIENNDISAATSPKDEVEIIHPDVAIGPRCSGRDCENEIPTKSVCGLGEQMNSNGQCVVMSEEEPAKYMVRVPHQCPDGYRAHRGVCHLVW